MEVIPPPGVSKTLYGPTHTALNCTPAVKRMEMELTTITRKAKQQRLNDVDPVALHSQPQPWGGTESPGAAVPGAVPAGASCGHQPRLNRKSVKLLQKGRGPASGRRNPRLPWWPRPRMPTTSAMWLPQHHGIRGLWVSCHTPCDLARPSLVPPLPPQNNVICASAGPRPCHAGERLPDAAARPPAAACQGAAPADEGRGEGPDV